MRMEVVFVGQRRRLRLIRPCVVCSAEFSIQPSKLARVKSCPDCRRVNRKPPETLECGYCGGAFSVKGHLAGVQKYCSRECAWAASRVSPEGWKAGGVQRPCLECGASFRVTDGRLLYCSNACFRESRKRQDFACHQCGQPFNKKRKVGRARLMFCSRSCRAKHFSGAAHPLWRDVKSGDDRGPGWEALAEEIRRRDSYRCQRCGTKQGGRRKLDVHHIEPYRISRDNRPTNLVSLCCSCHKVVEHSPWQLGPAGRPRSAPPILQRI